MEIRKRGRPRKDWAQDRTCQEQPAEFRWEQLDQYFRVSPEADWLFDRRKDSVLEQRITEVRIGSGFKRMRRVWFAKARLQLLATRPDDQFCQLAEEYLEFDKGLREQAKNISEVSSYTVWEIETRGRLVDSLKPYFLKIAAGLKTQQALDLKLLTSRQLARLDSSLIRKNIISALTKQLTKQDWYRLLGVSTSEEAASKIVRLKHNRARLHTACQICFSDQPARLQCCVDCKIRYHTYCLKRGNHHSHNCSLNQHSECSLCGINGLPVKDNIHPFCLIVAGGAKYQGEIVSACEVEQLANGICSDCGKSGFVVKSSCCERWWHPLCGYLRGFTMGAKPVPGELAVTQLTLACCRESAELQQYRHKFINYRGAAFR